MPSGYVSVSADYCQSKSVIFKMGYGISLTKSLLNSISLKGFVKHVYISQYFITSVYLWPVVSRDFYLLREKVPVIFFNFFWYLIIDTCYPKFIKILACFCWILMNSVSTYYPRQ